MAKHTTNKIPLVIVIMDFVVESQLVIAEICNALNALNATRLIAQIVIVNLIYKAIVIVHVLIIAL
jgi:hypothetical protein